MCIICLFMVAKKSTKKYSSKIGQKTGTSKMEKNVIRMQIAVPLEHASQNLNSGNLLANGRNSFPSFEVWGNVGPLLSFGSSKGDRKAVNRDSFAWDARDSKNENTTHRREYGLTNKVIQEKDSQPICNNKVALYQVDS